MLRPDQIGDPTGDPTGISREWFDARGCHHRQAGPAVEYRNGFKMWYLHGRFQVCQTGRHWDMHVNNPIILSLPGYGENP